MNLRQGIRAALACLFLLGPASGQAPAQEPKPAASPAPARIVFIKEFPGSSPPYYAVSLTEEGAAEYATAPDDPQPLRFRLSESLTRQVFQIAARLNRFQGAQLEARRKVASMGKKTLRYEGGGQRHEASFNYSENQDAVALANLFEKISITQQHLLQLERLARFDRLGVMKQLLQIEISMNKGELVEPVQFISLLEEISGNTQYLHIARERAARLLERIRKGTHTANLIPGQS